MQAIVPNQPQLLPPSSSSSSSVPPLAPSAQPAHSHLPPPVPLAVPQQDYSTAPAPSAPPADFGSSPPLPPLPPSANPQQPQSLSDSLAQLQGEAVFATRPPPQVVQPEAPPIPTPVQQLEEEGAAGEFFIAGLTAKELFVRLPEQDAVSALLDKYLPPQQRPQRDLSGDWTGQTLSSLIASRNYRGTARYAYNAITQSTPEKTSYLLSHWLLRLHSLLRLRLVPQLAAELSALFALLPPSFCLAAPDVFPSETPRFHLAVPFDLHVLAAALPGLQGDKAVGAERLTALLKNTKEEMWAAKRAGRGEDEALGRGRAARVGKMLADLLVEIKATSSAITLLTSATPSPTLHRQLSRLHFSTGNLAGLSAHVGEIADERERREVGVLELVAQGKWAEAEGELRSLVEETSEDVEVVNNLAVVLLYSGKLDEAIALLSGLLSSNPSYAYNDPTVLFNLATLTELRTEQAGAQKIRMLRSAAEFGGQALDAGPFKLAL
ncbi:hypothetical protein JCM8097_007391 [Rhodosporidiobolus ruineniae]